ncbi:MAG: dolichyl-phosphate beta-glucosyltransferase [Sandaracinaceae bacterium]
MTRVSVVVPCYNEEERLPAADLLASLSEVPSLHFVFVDDGSKDGTYRVLESLRERAPDRIRVVKLPENRGKGEAVRAGLNAAIADGAAIVGFWDADLATPLSELPRMLTILEENASLRALLGSRVKLLGRQVDREPMRHLLGRGFATLIALTLELPVYDTQCGSKLFVVDESLTAALAEPFTARWMFDVELLARLKQDFLRRGLDPTAVIHEEPLLTWRDVRGSKVKLMDGVVALRDILRIRRRAR